MIATVEADEAGEPVAFVEKRPSSEAKRELRGYIASVKTPPRYISESCATSGKWENAIEVALDCELN